MTSTPTTAGPLAGIRVIDLATEWAELAGRVLADLGAEVIKVEPPGGARARRLPPFASGREDDPDGSLYWTTVALGKRSVVLDLAHAADRERLRDLLRGADILVESFTPGMLDALGLGYDDLRGLNPGLIYISVTPYGQTGPDALSPATELTIEAAGGLVGLQGDGDRPPVPVGFPQAAFHAGAQAAADAIIALNERDRSGLGQRLDVSAQAAVVWTLMHATGFPSAIGGDPPRTGEHRTDPPVAVVPGIVIPPTWTCADGLVTCTLGLGERGGIALATLMGCIAAEGAMPAELEHVAWRTCLNDVAEGRLDAGLVRQALDAIGAYFRRHTRQELLALACGGQIMLAPIYTVADLLSDPQLAARDFWQVVADRTHPGPFVRLSRTPVLMRIAAPTLGADQALVDAPERSHMPSPVTTSDQATAGVDSRATTAVRSAHARADGDGLAAGTGRRDTAATVLSETRPDSRTSGPARPRAFTGLKVADFAWVGVGPMTSKAFADHGATVIHIESATKLDVLRGAPPFKDGVQGIDRSQFFANFNTSKLGLALNLATEDGRKLARRLIEWADVVVESFTPGTMARWGLDYETVSRDRPELIMLSTCLRGQTGPERTIGGFGTHGAALAGLHGITGWPDRPPAGTWGAYTDFITPRYGISALASALYYRNRTGLGQHIDISQVEASIRFLEPLVLDYTVNGRVAQRPGHDSDRACPHGVYRTRGAERYVALAVETTEQWQALQSVAPLEPFEAPEYDSLAARLAAREAINTALVQWASDQDPREMAARLKAAGVPAAAVQRPSDLYADAQLAHRGFFVPLEHRVMGTMPYDGPVTQFSATPPSQRAAPCLGQHTHEVLSELIGLSEEEISKLAEAGVLT